MQDPSAETTELREGTVESLARRINGVPSLMEGRSRTTLRLAITAIHDILCNSSPWRRCDGNVTIAQPRFKLTVTRNVRADGLRAVYS
jgi:hypothetical protein